VEWKAQREVSATRRALQLLSSGADPRGVEIYVGRQGSSEQGAARDGGPSGTGVFDAFEVGKRGVG
jgi:hypothetical protein